MADNGNPGSTTVPSWKNFNGQFLGYSIVCGILAVFFLLYFNRVFASVLSYLLRTYTWHRYRIYIDVQAFQVSLLGGRVFFTGLRYHGNNETILIQNGHITWSYWLRRVRDVGIRASKKNGKTADGASASETDDKHAKLPCRINVAVSGVEWFVYNRSAAYDSMLDAMTDHLHFDNDTDGGNEELDASDWTRGQAHDSPKLRQRLRKSTEKHSDETNPPGGDSDEEKDGIRGRQLDVSSSASDTISRDDKGDDEELPLMLQLFPVHLECDKAALVMGNDTTRSLLIVKTKSLEGSIDAFNCQTFDPYRQVFKIKFVNPVMEMREHEGYKEDQLTRAVRDKQTALDSDPVQYRSFFRRHRRKVLGQLRNLVPYWRSSVESFSVGSRAGTATADTHIPGSSQWQGLSRYLNDDDDDDKLRWSSVEYAALNTVVDSPEATLTILWDVPGKVLENKELQSSLKDLPHSVDINGALPPAWAISLSLKGGTINYGPWADRQRAELQRVFFPNLCKDATTTPKLAVGSDRVPTRFNFYLEMDEEVILRVPTREDSKNWRWKKEALTLRQHRKQDRRRDRGRNKKSAATTAAEQRPYGWLDVKVGPNATVSYTMDMVARTNGYHNALKIDLPSTEVSTSINHGLLWRSGAQHISCDLSAPLKWNGLRTWRFDIDSDEMEVFILRDHIFLLIDLIDDWGSGPPPEYLLFTPFKYLLNLQLRNLKLNLNVNDVNIVNDPTNSDDNTYLVLTSPCLAVDTSILLDTYRPSKNAVPFEITAESLRLGLHTPPWNTQATFLASQEIGHLENLAVDGKYHYNSTTSPANTDTLVLNVSGQSLTFYLYGFLVRYFLQMKDNYFGDHIHFKTLDEYQETLRLKAQDPDAESANRPPPKKSNDLDVMLSICADDPKILLPTNLYSAKRHITIEAASLSVDLRFTNYYMDLDLCLSPLSFSIGDEEEGPMSPAAATSSTQLFVDGLAIYGHRLFGLPPTEPTYLCNWDLNVGSISGECSTEFLSALARGGKAFGFTLDDDENALIPYSSVIMYDVTFLRVRIESIQLWLHADEAAFLFSTGPIDVNFNDWARTHYSRRADIKIPHVELACVNSESATRHKSRLHSKVETDVFLRTSFHFALIGRKYDFSQERKLQQELVRRHDQRTHRTEFLLIPGVLEDAIPDHVDAVAQSVPRVPLPASSGNISDKRSTSSRSTSQRSKRLHHKSSFLSLSNSSYGSILRPGSVRGSTLAPVHGRSMSGAAAANESDELRPSMRSREYSASTGRQSAFFGTQEESGQRKDLLHNTVSFSSQYFAPYFPLENVRPDTQEAAVRSIETDENDGLFETTEFGLEDIDPDQLSQDCAHQSLLFEFPTGITAFLNATSLRSIAALVQAFQPTEADDILDTLQIGAITDIFDMQKQEKASGAITDFVVRLPHANLRFLNSSDLDATDLAQGQQDQYDVSLKALALATRSEKRTNTYTADSATNESRLSFHFRVASVDVSAAERLAKLDETHAAVLTRIERVMVSMGSKDVNYVDADVGAIRTKSSSSRIEYLAALIHRTNVLVSEMDKLFSGSFSVADERLKEFTYRVITEGQRASDPSFVVRPSAVLRAATRHLRSYDSWKLIARLRYMWTTLDPITKSNLMKGCVGVQDVYPTDVRQQVMAAFDRWRSWDLEDVGHAVLMNNIFGEPSESASKVNKTPTMAVIRVQETQFVLDPGPKQNQVIITDFTARVEERHGAHDGGQEASTDVGEPLTLVNIYCSRGGIHSNWDLCELVDDILRLYKKAESQTPKGYHPPKQHTPSKHHQSRPVHLAFVLGQGVISLDTINLSAESKCDNLKLSLLRTSGDQTVTDTNIILGCDSVTTRVWSHSQALATIRLRGASVFVAHELQYKDKSSIQTIRSAASSEDIKLAVKQDPVVLAEVVDLLVKDELAQLYELQQRLPSSLPEPEKQQAAAKLSSFRVNLALFLGSYTITLPLLRSLTYTISGSVARATTAATFGKEIVFDFDIKENSHDMQFRINNTPRSISLLQIPPANGRVTSRMAPGEHSITVFASLELVQLDASAVYSLRAALNRPEILNAINDLQQQGKIIQEHVNEIFGSPNKVKPASPKQGDSKLTYDIHTTLAGVKIFGNAPIKSDTEPIAHLSFCLDRVHLGIANKVHGMPTLDNPEIHVSLREIKFDIEKGSTEAMRSCGSLAFGALITATTRESEDGTELRSFDFKSDGFEANLSSDTVSTFVDVLGYMGDKINDLDTSRELEYLRKLRQTKPRIAINDEEQETESDIFDSFLASILYSVEIRNIQLSWLVSRNPDVALTGQEDLVLSFRRIEFATRKKNCARLTIEDLQVQMVPPHQQKANRSANSALLPEMIFNIAFVSTAEARRLAFQAVGKSLDLRLTSAFIVPAAHLQDSISLSIQNVQRASEHWTPIVPPENKAEVSTNEAPKPRRSLFGKRRVESLLVDADFAGAVVHLSGKKPADEATEKIGRRANRHTLAGKYGQFSSDEAASSTILRTPGLAWKTEYRDDGKEDPNLYGEIKIEPSRNVLYPAVVPLIMDVTSSIKEVVGKNVPETPATPSEHSGKPKLGDEDNILTADPSAIMGRMNLNIGLRICQQEFTLSCQPIGRVAATARFDDIYLTMSTVNSTEHGNFFAISGTFSKIHAAVQHVYSRESTGSFDIDSMVLSLMNSKHVSETSGLSAILKVSPMKVTINAKQLQDFLLFREIWIPREIRQGSTAPVTTNVGEPNIQGHLVQRYQQVAATAAFPWTATISISALDVALDLGQSLGKSQFAIKEFWVSSKKTSDWEQNLCLGFESIGVDCTGRMSGFVALQDFKLRTSIEWPDRHRALNETPRIQASFGFSQLKLKAAFDYQAFLIADITSLQLLMWNVRQHRGASGDRLVAVFDGEAVQVFGTTASAAQGVALWQAIQKLIQERKASYETSLRDIEKFMKRKSAANQGPVQEVNPRRPKTEETVTKSPISLDTDVVVTLKALNLGVFPSTFSDHQVFKLEALNAQARFAASMTDDRIHSILGLTLGQLRIGLAAVRATEAPKVLSEISVENVVKSATGSRGGTILKVPKVEAIMQTWQKPESRSIQYTFKSAFEGKVEVGWNYSRISYIRGMWAKHSKALAQMTGREIPAMSAIKVTGVPEPEQEGRREGAQQQKITAEVNVPQSKYEYEALEPPVIETPQLRDMGEATPPLEWIGLHRERLPNLTHQIVIVALLELAGEVEDAYAKILGSS
ncbi:Uu.00g010260.m01.CDS01 [Anthostomella pinea]|uniref:Uu.00g010260.m01.CDS01 n=1 Tax=Anthostomella pinea TaxID=933095 RepID=A0AAI8VXJ0_9PEZI|nr:Uu.00g010260.m01.CDS01 [Anthostomella pinea]